MAKTAESVLQDARKNNEPVLVLRAKDKCAWAAVQQYLNACRHYECDKQHIEGVKEISKDFEQFKKDNPEKMKFPD